MTQRRSGADSEELRQFGADLLAAQRRLTAVQNDLSARISSNLRWEGADAFVFRHAWRSSYAPVLGKAASMLADASAQVVAEAAAQDEASGL